MKNSIGLILFVFTSIISFAYRNEVKVIVTVHNNVRFLPNALAFVYLGDSLISHSYFSSSGSIVLKLQKESEYLIVISNPGHLTSKITLNTEKMFADQVNKVFLDCKLYNLRDKDVDLTQTNFKVKWNPITEQFEYFTQNFGWIEEIKQLEGLTE